eukprot:PITA_16392
MPSNRNNPTTFSIHAKKKNNAGSKNQSQGIPGFKNGRKGRCFVCNKFGHYSKECPNRRDTSHDDDHNHSRYSESNVVNSKQKEFYLISFLSIASPLDTLGNWLMNSVPSRHFTRYKEALSNLIENDTNLEIILGDKATYPVKGVGNITIQLNQGNIVHIQEVLYVPDLKKNCVSISVMEDKGFKVEFIDGEIRVWKINFKE